jgi:cytochrome b pre-mRNA-processing protein 3
MTFLTRIFGGKRDRNTYRPLYDAIVNAGRAPDWYVAGQVPDSIDGRFDMIAAVLALTLIRLEAEGEGTRDASVLLTELFIDDMDGSIRQLGIGDLMVGKHVGRMMGALGGRLAAFRSAIDAGEGFDAAVARNIFHDAPPSEEAVRHVSRRLGELHRQLADIPSQQLLEGTFPG